MRHSSPLQRLKDGDHVLRVYIAPEFMEPAQASWHESGMAPAEYFARLFEWALELDLQRHRRMTAANDS